MLSYAQAVLDSICPAQQLRELFHDMAARAPVWERTAPCAQLAVGGAANDAAAAPVGLQEGVAQLHPASLRLERWWWYFQQ